MTDDIARVGDGPNFGRGPLGRVVRAMSTRARTKRAKLFRASFNLDKTTTILDLGGGNGTNISAVIEGTPVEAKNVVIADIEARDLKSARERFGFSTVTLDESGELPFAEKYFDIVYCSSVIEHVTMPKNQVWRCKSSKIFRSLAWTRQQEFANEIMRIANQYYVQTPSRHFPIESHSLLPFVGWLPRGMLLPILRVSNNVWIKKTSPDWNLLDIKQMARLFGSGRIVREKWCGLTKSIIAVHSSAVSSVELHPKLMH